MSSHQRGRRNQNTHRPKVSPEPAKDQPISAELQQLRLALEYSAKLYALEENPVYAWQAVADCCEQAEPLPQWVRAYLHRVARQICMLSEQVPAKRHIAAAVLTALEFRSPGKRKPGAHTIQERSETVPRTRSRPRGL